MDCTFCKIYREKKEIICDSEYFFTRFDKFPISPGHAEVIPKRHVASLFDLTFGEWEDLRYALPQATKQIRLADFVQLYQALIDNPINEKSAEFCRKMLTHIGAMKKPGAYNIGINEGEAAGRAADHLHIHLIPRFFGDVKDCVGGIRHIIPGMGNYRT